MLKSHWRTALVIALVISGCDGQSTEPHALGRITMIGGDRQITVIDSYLAAPLTVRVADNRGEGISGIRIFWRIATGSGVLATFPDHAPLADGFSFTNREGVATVVVRPTSSGTNVVVASAPEISGTSVIFTTTVSPAVEAGPLPAVIKFSPVHDCTGFSDPYLFDPKAGTVMPGVPVEWLFMDWVHPACTARIKSTSVPTGGEFFDSGIMSPGQRFRFLPNTTGTWEYIEQFSGGKGSFTVISLP